MFMYTSTHARRPFRQKKSEGQSPKIPSLLRLQFVSNDVADGEFVHTCLYIVAMICRLHHRCLCFRSGGG